MTFFVKFGGGYHSLVPYNTTPTLEQSTGLSIKQLISTFLDSDARSMFYRLRRRNSVIGSMKINSGVAQMIIEETSKVY